MLSIGNHVMVCYAVKYSFSDTQMCVCVSVCGIDDGEAVYVFNKHNTPTPHTLTALALNSTHKGTHSQKCTLKRTQASANTRLKLAGNLCTNNYFLIASNAISCQRNIQMHLRQSSILSA